VGVRGSGFLSDPGVTLFLEAAIRAAHGEGNAMCEITPGCDHSVDAVTETLRTERVIATYGHAVQWVAPGDGEPCFAYTVGLASGRLPELIIFGLSGPVSAEILNGVAAQMRGGRTLVAGQHFRLWDGDEHVHVLAQAVSDPTRHLLRANERHGAPVYALQLVWSDWSGLFPGEPDCTLTSADQILLA
jgi:hypothetical protein